MESGFRNPNIPMHTWYKRQSVRWRKDWLEAFNHRCWMTGELARYGKKLTVHHYPSEKQIVDKTLNALHLPHHKIISHYATDDIYLIKQQFKLELGKAIGIPLLSDVHRRLHKMYGKHPTLENMIEFKNKLKEEQNDKILG
jgi:hypothetical protein